MRLLSLSVLGLFACSTPAPPPAALELNLGPMFAAAQSAQITVSKVGLLVIQGVQKDPAEAQAEVQSTTGAGDSTAAVNPTKGDASKSGAKDKAVTTTTSNGAGTEPVVLPTGDGGTTSSDTTTSSTANPARADTGASSGSSSGSASTGASGTTSSKPPSSGTATGDATSTPDAAEANPVLGSIANGGASASSDTPTFGYYPVDLDSAKATFHIAVPSGDNQTLMLIAFITDPTTGVDLPVYIGELDHVDLTATDTKKLAFTIHPAGLVRPQVLPPSSLGLSDANGAAVSAIPDLNCLAVATADRTREGFPDTTAARLAVGTLSNLTTAQKASGAMILPVGHWSINCFANFADHLLSLAADQVIAIDVEQGHVYAPTAPLVATAVIAGGPSGGGGGVVGGSSSGTGGTTVLKAPHVALALHGPGNLSREVVGGGPTVISGIGPIVANFATSDADPDLTIMTVDDDGAALDFTGIVRITVDTLDNKFPLGWDPYNGKGIAANPRSIDVAVTNGVATVRAAVSTSTLVPDLRTLHLALSVAVVDASGNVLRPSGVFVFTVRADKTCESGASAAVSGLSLFTLSTNVNTLTASIDASGNVTPDPATVVAVAWAGAAACTARTSSDIMLGLSATPEGVLDLPTVLPLPVSDIGQWIYYDALMIDAAVLAKNHPPVGTTEAVSVNYEGPVSGVWNITTRVTN